ncbi:MAG: cysteine desulfurase [Pseudomonadota bacterium]
MMHTSPLNDYDLPKIRAQFPILSRKLHNERNGGVDLVYLDNAASAQKPLAVLERIDHLYRHDYANVHRGLHSLSEAATDAYEHARQTLADFLGAPRAQDIIWTRNGSEAINLVASSFGERMHSGDNVIISGAEHHSNIVPWQILSERRGVEIRPIPIDDDGHIELDQLESLCDQKTRLIAITHISNALGMRTDIETATAFAQSRKVPILIDGCQGAVHEDVNLKDMGCDFYIITGHKLYGPSGIGALWAKQEHLESMPPYQSGGEMIRSVSLTGSTFAPPPAKFEAGTPPIAQAIGLGAALDYINAVGRKNIHAHERALTVYAAKKLRELEGIRLIGRDHSHGIVSFCLDDIHPHDVATFLDHQGVAIRAGHHCAEPVMQRFGLPGTVRASLAMYNSQQDIDTLIVALTETRKFFA